MLGENLSQQPLMWWLCSALLFFLACEAVLKRKSAWAIPALLGYATIAAWYLIEPFYDPEAFIEFPPDVLDSAYLQVALFLVVFRATTSALSKLAAPPYQVGQAAHIPAETILKYVVALWLMLFAVGTYRLGGSVIDALLPLESRWESRLWSRAAAGDAGPTGFLVSTGQYLYTLTSAAFGILLPFIRNRRARWVALLFICLSWPYFLLEGSRNIFLAVFLPTFASYLLFSRHTPFTKIIMGVAFYFLINFWFHIVIVYRNIGFSSLISEDLDPRVFEGKHLGLNMMSELCYINYFYNTSQFDISWGSRYFAEFANVIPRAIWPGKPLIGIDYAILRGFTGGSSDIGVTATISSGIIGQGFLNFGPIAGPAIAATLLACWVAILARFRQQQASILRLTLFLLGLGLTFNIGRDITLLVLWPIVFGYITVRILEWHKAKSNLKTLRRGSRNLQNRIDLVGISETKANFQK